jgi:glycosyltransferase involved in cell wall biosynthesis
MPKVSVIMNCYNSDAFLREAIDSVYAQTFGDWEIIFWDNQSTDESAAIAQSYDARLRYFRAEEFLPLGAARNRALAQATGELVAILDCDDIWKPEKLERQVKLFETDPAIGVVYSNCDIVDQAGGFLGLMLAERQLCAGEVFAQLMLFKFFPPWPTVVIRKSVCGEFQAYKIMEDYDLLLRIAYQSRFGYIADSLAKYRTHPHQASRDYQVTLREQLAVCETWAKHPDFQGRERGRLISKARARSYISAATTALYQKSDAALVRDYLRQSLREELSVRAVFYFAASLLGLQRAGRLLGRLRSTLGYSQNLHAAQD